MGSKTPKTGKSQADEQALSLSLVHLVTSTLFEMYYVANDNSTISFVHNAL